MLIIGAVKLFIVVIIIWNSFNSARRSSTRKFRIIKIALILVKRARLLSSPVFTAMSIKNVVQYEI